MAKSYKLALFGNPVTHSLSPRIHGLFGQQLGVDVDYRATQADPEQLPDRLARFRAEGGIGANLTVPLKQAGIRLCDRVDPAARRARAVNTLLAEGNGWQGFNTDGAGLVLDLERLRIPVAGKSILIIGAGGAVAGMLGPLLEREPSRVCLLNRTPDRAERLADKFAHLGNISAAALAEGPDGGDFELLIQSTSAAHNGSLPLVNRSWLATDASAYDLNYGKAHQGFARWCQAHELPCHDGLGMLVGQAALAFEIWTGQRPETSPVLEALRQETGDR